MILSAKFQNLSEHSHAQLHKMEETGEPPFLNETYLSTIDGMVKLLKNKEANIKVEFSLFTAYIS